jgi:hypothetical protein
MSCRRRFCRSCLSIFVGLLLSLHSACAEDAPWEAWIPASPTGHDSNALYQKFLPLSKEQRVAALLYLIQKWDSSAKKEVFALADAFEIRLNECFEKWARRDFNAALERAEQWDGLHGNSSRIAVILAVAKSDPVEAARRMRARFDPMSRSYYYYVTIYGLVPALTDQPARIVLQAWHEMRSDLFFMDEFRWGDAASELGGTQFPWNPPNPSRDWEYLISQPSSMARDLLLCLTLRVLLKKDLKKAIALEVPPLFSDMIKYRLEDAFPDDLMGASELLPVANIDLLRSWVKQAARKNVQPEWRQWASLSAYQPIPAARDRALDTVMRLWLERDEVGARTWMQDLPAGPARVVAEAVCLEAEVSHLISEDWARAFNLAKSMPEGARRQRCLKTVFAGAAGENLDFIQKELAPLSLPVAQQAQIRDAWRLSRSDYLSRLKNKDGHGAQEDYALILELEDAGMRRMLALARLSLLHPPGSEDVNAVIEKSSMSREEKDACLLQVILLAVDGSPTGLDAAGCLQLSQSIADAETRFVHQRSVVRYVAEENPVQALSLVENSSIKEEDKQRLRKDLELISKWEREKKAEAKK